MGARADAFVKALKYLNKTMKADNEAGNQWRYYNSKASKSTFAATRKAGKYYTNCVGGVQFALKEAGLATGQHCRWYGQFGIHWFDAAAEKKAKEIFKIIDFKGKSVGTAINDGSLKAGDIVTYKNLTHTNAYIGNGKSFDSGHAYCKESGEGAKFIKWIGTTPYKDQKIAYVLRLKEENEDYDKTPKWVAKVSYSKPINVKVKPGQSEASLPEYPKLNPGNLVDVCDEGFSAAGNKWYYIRIAGKYFGWVYSKRLTKV